MQKNPYAIGFGRIPKQVVGRPAQKSEVVSVLQEEDPSQQAFMIMGPRGSGKTVFMTDVANTIAQMEGWIVEDLNVERDLLVGLASRLSGRTTLSRLFSDAKINLSFLGFGIQIDDAAPITDVEMALERMLTAIKRSGRRLLVTIDEVVSNQFMREFASAFQIFVRHDLPIYLIMTGLYDNINRLRNEKSLTFLYRTPKVFLRPLGLSGVAADYRATLQLNEETSVEMARLTNGYPFAFQALGHLLWNERTCTEETLERYKALLNDYAYEKIWSEMSPGDRRVARGIALSPTHKVKDVLRALDMKANQFSPYRERLIRKGIVDGSAYGEVAFTLPFFADYVLLYADELIV